MDNKTWIIGFFVVLAAIFASGRSEGEEINSDYRVTTIAGSSISFGSIDGTGRSALFRSPDSITTDGTNLYVADTSNHTIRKIVISTRKVTTLAGRPGVPGTTDGDASTALFNYPHGITSDGTNLYVADTSNSTIRKIEISTGAVTTIAGSPGVFDSTDGIGSVARFSAPYAITTDGTNLYIGDTYNGKVRKMVILSGKVTTLAGPTFPPLEFISGITTDGINVYVVDSGSSTIRKIEIVSGKVTTMAGAAKITGNTDGPGQWTLFSSPQSIATDGKDLYISDSTALLIRKINISTGDTSTLFGTTRTAGLVDEKGLSAQFIGPHGITINKNAIYLTDEGTIRQISCEVQ